jgi:hypothetical protein
LLSALHPPIRCFSQSWTVSGQASGMASYSTSCRPRPDRGRPDLVRAADPSTPAAEAMFLMRQVFDELGYRAEWK